jgi:FMN reductase
LIVIQGRRMTLHVCGLAGSLSSPSRTKTLVDLAVGQAAARFGATSATYGLLDLQPSLGQAGHLDALDPAARAVVDEILAADALVVGSPVYKGSYAGLFKHLFDLIEPAALLGKPILLTATGGGDRHALVIEHQLRPLFGFFEAATMPTGVYAGAADFADGRPTAPALLDRLDRAVGQLSPWLETPRPARTAA